MGGWVGGWVGYVQEFVEVFVHLQDSRLVPTSIAVVGGGEDGHHVHVVRPVVALFCMGGWVDGWVVE